MPQVLKISGSIVGAKMSAAEKKAVMIEVRKVMAEENRKNQREIDAVILWRIHEKFGAGPKKLKEFYFDFDSDIDELCNRYETDDSDTVYLHTRKLEEYGINLEEWEKEKKEKQNNDSEKER